MSTLHTRESGEVWAIIPLSPFTKSVFQGIELYASHDDAKRAKDYRGDVRIERVVVHISSINGFRDEGARA
jgi:hypothetical protein